MTTTQNTTAPAEFACHFCSVELDYRHIDGNHWDGERYIRVAVCDDCFGARKLAKAPRKPRGPRQPVQVNMASDWNMLVALQKGRKHS